MKNNIIFIILLFFLTSCIERRQKGFYFGENADKIKNLDTYYFNKRDIIENIGYPTMELEDGTWLYYSQVTKNLKVLKAKLDSELVLLVAFDGKDNIKNFSYREINNSKNLDYVEIEAKKEKKNFFKQLIDGLIFTPMM
jgi:outer membrane protein assembly factor BamE (lipoprotein component of BamABCDE complex)